MPTVLGREIGRIGYGLHGHTMGHKIPSEENAIESLRTAAELGCLLWDGGEFYGKPDYNSLVLLNRFFRKYPQYADKVVLNIKGAQEANFVPNSSPAYIKESVSNCLAQLDGTAKIAMFECARRDVKVPLKDTLDALQKLVQEGKIESVALSEVNAKTIQEASKIIRIAAVEVELSLWCTDPLINGIAQTCVELNIPILAYCPVGRGMLTGALQSLEDIDPIDFRRKFPRYQEGNFEKNFELVKALSVFARKKKCTPAQLAIGWLLTLSKRPDMPMIIPIPGSTSTEHVQENAVEIDLSEEEMKEIDSILQLYPVAGDRYPPFVMKLTNL